MNYLIIQSISLYYGWDGHHLCSTGYDFLAAIFLPSLGTTDIILREEALTNFTREASNDNMMEIAAFNSRQALMCQALCQNRKALDILMAAQVGTCAIIHTECCVYIADYSKNVSDSLQDLKSNVQAMADSTPSFGTVLWNWISISTWWKPLVQVGSLCSYCCLALVFWILSL